jgi:DNA-damage-inducible protein J
MSLAQVVAKVPQEEKDTFYELTSRIGTTPSNAIRMFISAFNQRGAFPFDLSQPRYDAEVREAMREVDDMIAGRIPMKRYATVDELRADLESELADDQA